MGQGSLFGGWEATQLEVSMGFVPNKGSGWIHVATLDEEKRALSQRSVSWTKERDWSGIGDVMRGIGYWWLYGTPEAVINVVPALVDEHLPRIGAGDARAR